MAVEDVDDGFGVVVGGDTEKADDLLVLHLGEGFHGAAVGEDGVDLLGDANVVEQPEVEVIGLHELEGLFDITEGAVAAALSALGGKEDVVAAVLHDASDVLLAPALGESVSRGGVDEVDAEVEGSLDERDGDVEVVWLFDSALAAEGEDADLVVLPRLRVGMEACVLGLSGRAGSWFVAAWASWERRPAARTPPVFKNRRRLVKEEGCFMGGLSEWANRPTLIVLLRRHTRRGRHA